jgi:hypothetical protein
VSNLIKDDIRGIIVETLLDLKLIIKENIGLVNFDYLNNLEEQISAQTIKETEEQPAEI